MTIAPVILWIQFWCDANFRKMSTIVTHHTIPRIMRTQRENQTLKWTVNNFNITKSPHWTDQMSHYGRVDTGSTEISMLRPIFLDKVTTKISSDTETMDNLSEGYSRVESSVRILRKLITKQLLLQKFRSQKNLQSPEENSTLNSNHHNEVPKHK